MIRAIQTRASLTRRSRLVSVGDVGVGSSSGMPDRASPRSHTASACDQRESRVHALPRNCSPLEGPRCRPIHRWISSPAPYTPCRRLLRVRYERGAVGGSRTVRRTFSTRIWRCTHRPGPRRGAVSGCPDRLHGRAAAPLRWRTPVTAPQTTEQTTELDALPTRPPWGPCGDRQFSRSASAPSARRSSARGGRAGENVVCDLGAVGRTGG